MKTLKMHCSRTNEPIRNGRWLPFCDTAYPLGNKQARKNQHRTVPADAFRWVPREKQCNRCRHYSGVTEHGTHEHLMAVELLVAMLQALWQARLEVGHRCYVTSVDFAYRGNTVRVDGHGSTVWDSRGGPPKWSPLGRCTCGAPSWTDPRRWEWDVASVLAHAADKYCYPHVCEECGIRFQTERPRGARAWCGMCVAVDASDPSTYDECFAVEVQP